MLANWGWSCVPIVEGGRGGCLARLVLDPQRPLVCWPVGEGVVVDDTLGGWLTNNA
jgi:hypothetical protein